MAMPFVAVQHRLQRETMDCDKCQQTIPERDRGHMGCGWLPRSRRLSSRGLPSIPGMVRGESGICPYYLAMLPQVREAAVAWTWRDKGQLQLLYAKPSYALLNAIDVYHGSVNQAQDYLNERILERQNGT